VCVVLNSSYPTVNNNNTVNHACCRQVACNNYYCTENKLAGRLASLKQLGQIQKGYNQSKLIIKSADPKDNVIKTSASHKTSHKTYEKSHDALAQPGETPRTEIYLKILEAFESANHHTITQAVTNWNTWRKWEFPCHMTIYGYK